MISTELLKIQTKIPAIKTKKECVDISQRLVELKEKAYQEADIGKIEVLLYWIAILMGEKKDENEET